MRNLWHTGYTVSSLSFLAFSYLEWQIPGFVSYVFPLYLVLVPAVITGVGALLTTPESRRLTTGFELGVLAISILLSLLVFHAADVFGAYRLVIALLVLLLPPLLLKALSDVKD